MNASRRKRRVHLFSMGKMPWYRHGERLFFFYTPRLGLPSLAAVTPSDWEVSIFDGVDAEAIDFDALPDLAGFSVLTPFAPLSYRVADDFRRRGVPVVMGGVHPSLLPEEAKRHADAVVIGEADTLWPALLRDVRRGCLRPYYRADAPVDPATLPAPAFDALANPGDYYVAHAVQVIRGCPHGAACPFCIVPKLFGARYRVTPPDGVVSRMRQLRARYGKTAGINLTACCPLNHTDYIRDLAHALEPLGMTWCGAALLDRLDDPSLLQRLRAAGCVRIYTESDVVSPRKNPARHAAYCAALEKIHAQGIAVAYNFTVGLDDDDDAVRDDVIALIERTGLDPDLCAVQRFTPWPNTPAFDALAAEGRIVDRNWAHYDNMHTVFRPKSTPPSNRNETTLK